MRAAQGRGWRHVHLVRSSCFGVVDNTTMFLCYEYGRPQIKRTLLNRILPDTLEDGAYGSPCIADETRHRRSKMNNKQSIYKNWWINISCYAPPTTELAYAPLIHSTITGKTPAYQNQVFQASQPVEHPYPPLCKSSCTRGERRPRQTGDWPCLLRPPILAYGHQGVTSNAKCYDINRVKLHAVHDESCSMSLLYDR